MAARWKIVWGSRNVHYEALDDEYRRALEVMHPIQNMYIEARLQTSTGRKSAMASVAVHYPQSYNSYGNALGRLCMALDDDRVYLFKIVIEDLA